MPQHPQVRFGPEAAFELHKTLYRAKLASLVDKGRLTEADVADLKRIRRILCITNETANKARRACVPSLWLGFVWLTFCFFNAYERLWNMIEVVG